ncbi:MAG TPA: hypothetical protein DDX91_03720 [Ruminococcaceae bacterium]|nr:hypothetical protein [Oscillospiraceae bacterium]
MKKKRQAEILSIIKEQTVENQDMLIKALAKRGYKVTQATVSRDINELRLEKNINDDGISCYSQITDEKKYDTIFHQSITGVDYAMNIVCLKCRSGLANAACATFDIMNPSGVVGTIAGDDTVFILTRTESDAKQLCEKIRKMI